MSECKDYKITVTISMMGEKYVKRHFLEMEPLDKPFIREVRTEAAD